MPLYEFEYIGGTIERMEGRNKTHAYKKVKKILPDRIPFRIENIREKVK